MEPSLWIRLITPVMRLLGFVKKKSEKKYSIYKFYKDLNISANAADFDSIYNQTLFDFENSNLTHPKVVDLFKTGSAKEALRVEYYNKTENYFYTDLDTNLNTLSQFSELKEMSINLEDEIIEFLKIFNSKVNQSKLPKEIETVEEIKALSAKVDKLFINNKNIHLPEQLKEINELRKNNNHNAVLNLLNNLKEKKWDELTPELKYSVLLHLAATYIDLSEKKKAASYFIELPALNHKPEEAYGYASLGYALLGETGKSIDYANKALSINKEDLNAYLGLLFSKEETLEIEDLDTLIPKHLQDNPQIAINIGTVLEKKHEYDKAFSVFEKLDASYAEMDSFKCDILVQLGTNRMHAINNKEDYLFNQLDEDAIAKVTYANESFEKAWEYLKNTDLRFSRWYVLTNKGVSNKVLGRKEQAEKDFTDSLELKKTYFTYRHLLILKMDAGENLDEIISEIEKLELSEQELQELAVFKSDKLFSEGKNEDALNILLNKFSQLKEPDLKKQFGSMIIETYLRMANFGEAERYAMLLVEDFSEDPLSFYNLSKVHYNNGESEKGLEYLLKSKSLITAKTPRFIANHIVDKLINYGELVSAAEVLEIIANQQLNSDLTRKLITVYFHAGNHKKAMNLTAALLKVNPDDPFLVDVTSSIYETTENYDEAISTISSFLLRHPDNKFMLAKVSMNYYKKGNYNKGVEELDKIKDYTNIPVPVQFLIAHSYVKNKNYKKGLEIAYGLRTMYYSDPSIHTKYIQCITGMEDLGTSVYFPEIIGKDCYVVLKDDSQKAHTYIIVDKPETQNEISFDEPLGAALIGKRIGDTLNWNGGTLRVESILWKYTYALHDSMDQLYTRFGNTEPIKVFKLKEGGEPAEQFKDIFKMIDSAQEFDKQIEQLYLQGKSTIGVNAAISGLSPIKYWGKLVSSSDIGITSIGTAFEFQIGMQQLTSGKPLIIDITALLTLFYIDALPLLQNIKNRKIITKSTLEIIEKEITDLKSNMGAETVVVNKIGSQYFRHIFTKEDKGKQLEKLNEFLKKINEVCEVVILQLSENYVEKEKKDKLLGQSFNESILVSQEMEGLLFSDDAFLRALSFNDFHVNGISTFIFTIFNEREQLIKRDDTGNLLEKLIKLNYRNIPSNAKLLYKIFADSNYNVQQPFINACDFINPNFLNDVQAAKFVVDFLLEVYLSATITFTKGFVTQFILSKLFVGRNSIIVRRFLIALLDTKFHLLPKQRDEIMDIIKKF